MARGIAEHRIDPEFLREKLIYCPETGAFFWRNGWLAGKPAGTVTNQGYLCLKISRGGIDTRLLAHRAAFFFMTGNWPKLEIDHINRDRLDNRWANLREVPKAVQSRNRTCKGVSRCMATGKFKAYVAVNKRQIWLGRFDTEQEALEARRAGELRYWGWEKDADSAIAAAKGMVEGHK